MGQRCRCRIEDKQSRVHATEMTYLRGACTMSRWDGEKNESIYERFGMDMCANGVVE